MSFITAESLRRTFRQSLRRAGREGKIPARTGRMDTDGTLNPNPVVGLPANKIWVRLHARSAADPGRRQLPVWNTTFAVSTDRADTAVWVDYDPDGELEVAGLRNYDASNALGAALTAVLQKIVPPELYRQLHRILNVMELRPYVRSDGDLGFKSGWIGRLYWDDSSGIDPLLFKTSTSGQQAWVVVYMDTSGGTLALDAETGADITAGVPKDRADIEAALVSLPAGAFPLFALLIKESDSSFSVTNELLTEDLRDRWAGVGAAAEAHDIDYTPDDGSHWDDPDPDSVGDGLDQLAERVTEAEGDVAALAERVEPLELRITNGSGGTVVVGDVGYIDSDGSYKETSTANASVEWCVVTEGGADSITITVAKRGVVTVTLNANCGAGDYLVTSTTAGQAGVSTFMRPEVFALALTANASGAGGTCTALLCTGTAFIPLSSSNDIWRLNFHSSTDFAALINASGSGGLTATNVPYDTVSAGSDNAIKPASGASELGKMRLYNSTRGNYRLIVDVDTSSDVITTVSSTDNWQDGDSITIVSPTVSTGAAYKAIEVDMSQATIIPPLTRALALQLHCLDSAANVIMFVHPAESYATAKQKQILQQVGGIPNTKTDAVSLIDSAFTVVSEASGAGTKFSTLLLDGVFVATS